MTSPSSRAHNVVDRTPFTSCGPSLQKPGNAEGERGAPKDGPTQPPTPEELRGLAQAPAPPVNISPDGRGATGLPTRLWGDPLATVVVGPLVLRSWSVTGTAGPTLWEWTMGSMDGTRNPDPHLSSTRAGSESDPAALYTNETKGGFTVVATVSYNGAFTVTGPYGVTVSANVGSIAVCSSRAYDVVEVRSARD